MGSVRGNVVVQVEECSIETVVPSDVNNVKLATESNLDNTYGGNQIPFCNNINTLKLFDETIKELLCKQNIEYLMIVWFKLTLHQRKY